MNEIENKQEENVLQDTKINKSVDVKAPDVEVSAGNTKKSGSGNKKPSKHYADNDELIRELKLSFEQDMLTDRAVKIFTTLIERIARPLPYKGIELKRDCLANTLLIVCEKWRGFDINRSDAPNPFSFFTSVITNGLTISLNEYTNSGTVHFSLDALHEGIDQDGN